MWDNPVICWYIQTLSAWRVSSGYSGWSPHTTPKSPIRKLVEPARRRQDVVHVRVVGQVDNAFRPVAEPDPHTAGRVTVRCR